MCCRLRGLAADHLLVYQCIEAAGNTGGKVGCLTHIPATLNQLLGLSARSSDSTGVWTKDMKFKTNLQQPQVTKILKELEQRTLVKAIKPVNQPSKKFYMLFDLEPAREITGGAW